VSLQVSKDKRGMQTGALSLKNVLMISHVLFLDLIECLVHYPHMKLR